MPFCSSINRVSIRSSVLHTRLTRGLLQNALPTYMDTTVTESLSSTYKRPNPYIQRTSREATEYVRVQSTEKMSQFMASTLRLCDSFALNPWGLLFWLGIKTAYRPSHPDWAPSTVANADANATACASADQPRRHELRAMNYGWRRHSRRFAFNSILIGFEFDQSSIPQNALTATVGKLVKLAKFIYWK